MKIYNKITPERNKKNEHYNNTMFDVYNYQYPNYGYTDNIETLTIPKTIHQLWVGDKLIPGHCKQFVDRMKKINPDYEHKFWGNEIFDLYKKFDDCAIFWTTSIPSSFLYTEKSSK